MAKSSHQQAGVDYHETFSPIIKPTTMRLVLAIAMSCKWSLRQLDVSPTRIPQGRGLYVAATWLCGFCLSKLCMQVT